MRRILGAFTMTGFVKGYQTPTADCGNRHAQRQSSGVAPSLTASIGGRHLITLTPADPQFSCERR
jgi:hypothetical protein